ncbi:MAG: histidine phosphatase family protein [Phycisphaeraceae bacterium]|nr:histidine phosphatase family protein [Phycisphaeraceae bacterium]
MSTLRVMRLLLVRHAKAFDRDPARWPDDSTRPLTDEGRRAFRRLAERLDRWVDPPRVVLASAWSRAWETAQILEERALWPARVREPMLEDAEETGATAELLERIRRASVASMAMVGHEPFLSRFASRLLCGRADGVAIDFRKGAVIELEVDPEGPVGAVLRSLVHPALFKKS